MNKYVSVSKEELEYISDLTLNFDNLEIEEEKAFDEQFFLNLENNFLNPNIKNNISNKKTNFKD